MVTVQYMFNCCHLTVKQCLINHELYDDGAMFYGGPFTIRISSSS